MGNSTASTPVAEPLTRHAVKGERFLLLDGLRGIAAFAVILDHVPGGWLGDLLPGRYLAVDFFFVLSGFVLAHAYGEKLEQGWSPLAFMKARLIRLYPMYLLALGIGLSLSVLGALRGWVGPGWGDIAIIAAFGLLFLPAPPVSGGDQLYPANAPAWSLFFELVANLAYAFLARHLSWRVLGTILGVGALAVAATLLRHADIGGPGWLWSHLDAGLARVTFAFFAGVAIHRLRAKLVFLAMPWWLAIAAFIVVIAVQTPPEWRAVYDITSALVLMPMLVAFASGASVSGVTARLCAIFGLLSYGVYVLHVPLFSLLGVAGAVTGVQLAEGPLAVMVVAGLAAVVAALAHVAYDKPIRRWLSGDARTTSPSEPAAKGG